MIGQFFERGPSRIRTGDGGFAIGLGSRHTGIAIPCQIAKFLEKICADLGNCTKI